MKKQKRTRRVNKKIVLIITGVLVLLGAAAGGYWLYTQQQKEQARQEQELAADVKKEVDSIAFRGQNDVAVDYVVQLKQDNPQAAAQVFAGAIAAAKSDAEKIQLYHQHITLAVEYGLKQQALQASLDANELQNNYRSLSIVAGRYTAVGDTDKAVEYWQKAIAALDELPADINTDVLEAQYRDAIAKLKGGN